MAAHRSDVSARLELAQTYRDAGRSWLAGATRTTGDARSFFEKARVQYLDLRREGKLAPSAEKLLAGVDEEIASLRKRPGVS